MSDNAERRTPDAERPDRNAERDNRLEFALNRRGFGRAVHERVCRLLSGAEDRQRLRCCHSGCYVCVDELRAILTEVEGGDGH